MNIIPLGHTLVRLDSVDSTNQYAAQWLSRATVAEGTVIIARSQRQGKGQRGNEWISEEGKNLTFSLILTPAPLPVPKAYLLTHMAALAVHDTVAKYANTQIKWPNDVYCGDRKIAGVLVENTVQDGKIRHCIMGIGLNVNQTIFPQGIRATSLCNETQQTFDLDAVLQNLMQNLEKYYYQLITGKYDSLHRAYIENLYLKNVKKTYTYKGFPLEAEIVDVNDSGKLMLKTVNGIIQVDLKEIVFPV